MKVVHLAQQLHGARQANFPARPRRHYDNQDERGAHFIAEFPAGSCDAACG